MILEVVVVEESESADNSTKVTLDRRMVLSKFLILYELLAKSVKDYN